MIEKIAHKLTRRPKLVALIAVLMLIPSLIGYAATRINYDILSYLPQDLPSSQGEQLLEEPFQMAATSMLIVEGMPAGYTNKLIQDIQDVPGVSSAVWISNLVGIQIPVEMIPAELRDMFFSGQATMMLIQYDHPGASDETMEAIQQVRNACNQNCFLAGFSVVIKDTRDVMDGELPIFVGLAVLLALAAMSVTLESTVLPFVYLASIGMAVVYNFGSNIFLGQISYITKAIAAVLQLGVTMDYSIFLYHRYMEERDRYEDKRDAMARASARAVPNGSSAPTAGGVRVTQIVEDESPLKIVYDPTHPDADENGYLEMPNVDMVKEIADAMAASRAYASNVTAFNTLKSVLSSGLEIGR